MTRKNTERNIIIGAFVMFIVSLILFVIGVKWFSRNKEKIKKKVVNVLSDEELMNQIKKKIKD